MCGIHTLCYSDLSELEAGRCEAGSDNLIASEAQIKAQSGFGCLLFQEAFIENFLF